MFTLARRSMVLRSRVAVPSQFAVRNAGPLMAVPQRGMSDVFTHFWQNLRNEYNKNKELKESVKALQKEGTKIAESDTVKTLGKATDAVKSTIGAAAETVQKTAETIAQSETAQHAAKRAHQAAEVVSSTTKVVAENPIVKSVTDRVAVVKEELIDKAAVRSAPYQRPEVLVKRVEKTPEDLAREKFESERIITPNETEQQVVLHKDYSWQSQWNEWKDNNPIVQGLFGFKAKFDESDSFLARTTRSVTDTVTGVFGRIFGQTETAQALSEITKVDPRFTEDKFLDDVERRIIPTVLEAWHRGDLATLKDWCHEGAFNILKADYEARKTKAFKIERRVRDIRDINIITGKILDQGPMLVLTFGSQETMVAYNKKGEIVDGDPSKITLVMYVLALCRDQSIFDPKAAWRVLEIGIINQAGTI